MKNSLSGSAALVLETIPHSFRWKRRRNHQDTRQDWEGEISAETKTASGENERAWSVALKFRNVVAISSATDKLGVLLYYCLVRELACLTKMVLLYIFTYNRQIHNTVQLWNHFNESIISGCYFNMISDILRAQRTVLADNRTVCLAPVEVFPAHSRTFRVQQSRTVAGSWLASPESRIKQLIEN